MSHGYNTKSFHHSCAAGSAALQPGPEAWRPHGESKPQTDFCQTSANALELNDAYHT